MVTEPYPEGPQRGGAVRSSAGSKALSGSKRLYRALRKNKGQALVEFAIVVPLMMLIVLAGADFGIAYNYKNDQTNLAAEALRYAEVNACSACGSSSIEDFIKSTADTAALRNGVSAGSWGIQSPGVQISFCVPSSGSTATIGQVGTPIEAQATSNYLWLPFLKLGTAGITATSIGRIEQPYNTAIPATNAYSQGSGGHPALGMCP